MNMVNQPPDIANWQPLPVEKIQDHLGTFRNWCLCGGQSLDWIIGRITRRHGDTDIGVFRSDLTTCLESVGPEKVFLVHQGRIEPWDGGNVPKEIHDIWITEPMGRYWIFQVMVYDDAKDTVVYRRDPRIQWKKSSHAVEIRGLSILNPIITLLFKLNRAGLEEKDCGDIRMLIEEIAKHEQFLGNPVEQ
jgi:hypothetical protein